MLVIYFKYKTKVESFQCGFVTSVYSFWSVVIILITQSLNTRFVEGAWAWACAWLMVGHVARTSVTKSGFNLFNQTKVSCLNSNTDRYILKVIGLVVF